MWFKRIALKPRTGDELDVWVRVCVRLSLPLPGADGGAPAVGYYRNLGIRIPGPQPKAFLERLVTDGAVDWRDTEVTEIEPASLGRDVRAAISAPDADGVWYRSGRMYFPEDDHAGDA